MRAVIVLLALSLPASAASAARPSKRHKLTLTGSAYLQANSSSSVVDSQGCERTTDRQSEVRAAFKGSARKLRLAKRTTIPKLRMNLSGLSAVTRITTTTSTPGCAFFDVAPVPCSAKAEAVAFAVGSQTPGGLLAFRNVDPAEVFENCEAEDDVGGVLKSVAVTTALPQRRISRLKRGRTVSDKGTFATTVPPGSEGEPTVSVSAPYKITVKRTR